MCGINILLKYGGFQEQDYETLNNMNNLMPYRGPDGSEIWHDNFCGLGHVRLSIIGLDNGRQPIKNENNTIQIVCNGEIYNYALLKESLIKKGHVFKTLSDTEVILHLYEEYGTDCLEHLEGMFALAIWNSNEKSLFVARDRMGQKPLYYAQMGGTWIFSSELKTIIPSLKNVSINSEIGRQIICYTHSISEKESIIKQINKVPPAHFLKITESSFELSQYWTANKKQQQKPTFEEAKADIVTLLHDAVKKRLISEVPIATLLSGGVDSSVITCIAQKYKPDLEAITIGYEESSIHDERKLAKDLAKDLNIKLHEVELNQNHYFDHFEKVITYIDEPAADLSTIAQWALYKKAKELGYTVLISGNGSDEIFYGYPQLNKVSEYYSCIEHLKTFFPIHSRRQFITLFQFIYKNFNTLTRYTGLKKDALFIQEKYKNLYTNSYNETIPESYFDPYLPHIDRLYYFMRQLWLPNNCYHISDKLGMAHSLEIRSPFADHKLVEFVHNLPNEYKINVNDSKFLLKEAIKDIVPEYIINRPKKGFTPPLNYINNIPTGDYLVKGDSFSEKFLDAFLKKNQYKL